MGGATENDNAMTWFLQQANGGDVLVLRASGSDGYNNYMYSGLGVSVNSVEKIMLLSSNNVSSGSDGYNTYMYSGLGVSVNSVETCLQ